MSFDIYYTIRQNFKSSYYVDTLFFGKQRFYDYKRVVEELFDTYNEALNYIIENNLHDVHIRRTIESGGGCIKTDYKRRFLKK